MSNRPNAKREVSHTRPSAIAFVGGSYLPSIKAEKLGRRMRTYRSLWQAVEANNDYEGLLELYSRTLETKTQLADTLAVIEMTREIIDSDYGSA